MHEPAVTDVDADVLDPIAAAERQQVADLQLVRPRRNRPARRRLLCGGARNLDVDGREQEADQPAAVEAPLRRSAAEPIFATNLRSRTQGRGTYIVHGNARQPVTVVRRPESNCTTALKLTLMEGTDNIELEGGGVVQPRVGPCAPAPPAPTAKPPAPTTR